MTNALGLGTGTHLSAYMSWQNAEHSRHRSGAYGGARVPRGLREGLPGSLPAYNKWLEAALAHRAGNATARVKTLMGFVLGFRHDHPVWDPATNRLVSAGRNDHQEYNMFQYKAIPAYVCQDTFVHHNKSATASPGTKAAMEVNSRLVNNKGARPGRQS